ncbi:MAG: ankyrin repeat domain-containing protein [Xanthomonadaceae bacterium]|nr:ankyrin repeat domain-containing protein [Xanthomonadaceae bacterium]
MKEKEPTKESIDAACSYRSMLEYGTHDGLREEIECAPERLHLEGAYPLARAARMRDLEAVKILVEAGAPLDACGTERYELMSARNEREEFDCPLVECLNQRYDEGRPDNEDEVFSYLLQAGANPNLALNDVAKRHDIPKLHALIEAGADIKTYGGEALGVSLDWNYNGYGCLPEERGQALEVISTLLKHGADCHENDDAALVMAAENGFDEAAKVLLQAGADPNAHQGHLLINAVHTKNLDSVELFIQHGAQVNREKNNPLIEAARSNGQEMAELLIKHGAQVDGHEGEPLTMAIKNDNVDYAEALLKHGAQVNREKVNPLTVAAHSSVCEMAELLIKYGADVNGNNGEPLLMAGKRGNYDVAEVLMNHGAEPTLEIAEWSTGKAKDLIRARYEQDLLRRHLPQASSDPTQTPSIQPSRKQRL